MGVNIFVQAWWKKYLLVNIESFKFLEVDLIGITIQREKRKYRIHFSEIQEIKKEGFLIWKSIRFIIKNHKFQIISGLSNKDFRNLISLIRGNYSLYKNATQKIKIHKKEIIDLYKWLKESKDGNRWFSKYEIEPTVTKANQFEQIISLSDDYLIQNTSLFEAIKEIRSFLSDPFASRIIYNNKHLAKALEENKDYFDNLNEYPLTKAQRLAVVTQEKNTLVMAAAGSGKTAVINAKSRYLIDKGFYSDNELLIISYNRKVAEETKKKLHQPKYANIEVKTFHSLGREIVSKVEKRKPSLSSDVQDPESLKKLVREFLIKILRNPLTKTIVLNYFDKYFHQHKSESDFSTEEEYLKFIYDQEYLTFNNEYLKSHGEVAVANFLYANGIKYKYEEKYVKNTASEQYSQYKPDFYLPDFKIYIEHFGIDRQGRTAKNINSEEYWEGINYKRELHKKNETNLIETYHYEFIEGILEKNLLERLNKNNVEFQEGLLNRYAEKPDSSFLFKSMTNLLSVFIGHFKGGRHSYEKVREQARERKILNPRFNAFLLLFRKVYEMYEKHLEKNADIDYDDMINNAIDYVNDNAYLSQYKYILVDEFQDISINRSELLKALINQKSENKSICVGDDWQAIYRFAGSDISIINEFQKHFGFSEIINMEKTFRFNDQIAKVSTKFIKENPNQSNKVVFSDNTESQPCIFLHWKKNSNKEKIKEIVDLIENRNIDKNKKIMILGRYNYLKNDIPRSILHRPNINFNTVHTAKGLEADHVIIMGMSSGIMGFPSEIRDDSILDSILSTAEKFRYSEERRLFYVALTRAKKTVYLIVDYLAPSSFALEIQAYEGLTYPIGGYIQKPRFCPKCIKGRLVVRKKGNSNFLGCSNFYKKDCTYTERLF